MIRYYQILVLFFAVCALAGGSLLNCILEQRTVPPRLLRYTAVLYTVLTGREARRQGSGGDGGAKEKADAPRGPHTSAQKNA